MKSLLMLHVANLKISYLLPLTLSITQRSIKDNIQLHVCLIKQRIIQSTLTVIRK